MKFKSIYVCCFLVLLSSSWVAAQPSVGVDSKSSTTVQGDTTISSNKQFQQELSKTKRTADTFRKNMDKSTSKSVSNSAEKMRNRSVDIDLPLQIFFLDILAKWESEGLEPFTHYKIVTNPRMFRSFLSGYVDNMVTSGLQAAINKHVDADYMKSLEGYAATNIAVKEIISEDEVRKYIKRVAYYGCLIGQAFLYLKNDLDEFTIKTKEKDGTIDANISYDDFSLLAESALFRAAVFPNGMQSMTKKLYRSVVLDKTPCRFNGKVNSIRCGRSLLNLSSPPELNVSNRVVYGDSFAGLNGAFKVSSGVSWQDAIESLKTTTKGQEFAKEVTKSKDKLLSQGMTREAVYLTKAAWETVSGSSVTISGGSPTQ